MSAIEKKIKEHERESRRLSRKYPSQQEEVSAKYGEVQEAWTTLCAASTARDGALGAAYTLHKFQVRWATLYSLLTLVGIALFEAPSFNGLSGVNMRRNSIVPGPLCNLVVATNGNVPGSSFLLLTL